MGMFCGSFAFENPNADPAGNPTFVAIRSYVAANRPLANKSILHDKNRCVRGAHNHRKRLSFVNEARSRSILRYRDIEDDCVFGKPLQLFQECGHFQIGEIGELKPGFIIVQLLPDNGLKPPVIPKYTTTDHNHMLGAGLHLQRRVQGLCCVQGPPRSGEAGVEFQIAELVFRDRTKNDRSIGTKFFMCLEHEHGRGWSHGDD